MNWISRSHAPHGNAVWMRRIQCDPESSPPFPMHYGLKTVCAAELCGSHAAHGNHRALLKLMTLSRQEEFRGHEPNCLFNSVSCPRHSGARPGMPGLNFLFFFDRNSEIRHY